MGEKKNVRVYDIVILIVTIASCIAAWLVVPETLNPLRTIVRSPTSSNLTVLSCPYNGDSDQATFRNLLIAEHTAALTESLDIINEIFLPNTMMPDYSTGIPIPVLEQYQKKFTDVDFVTLNLDEIGIVRNDGTTAWVTKTGSGMLVMPETGEEVPFDMKASDGQFVFKRNADGCWKIAGYEQTSAH